MSWTAIASLVVLSVLYASAVFAPWIAPYDYALQSRQYPNCPPTGGYMNPPSRWSDEGML